MRLLSLFFPLFFFFVTSYAQLSDNNIESSSALYQQVIAGRPEHPRDVLVLFPQNRQEAEARLKQALSHARSAMTEWLSIKDCDRTVENTIHQYDAITVGFDNVRNIFSCLSESTKDTDLQQCLVECVNEMNAQSEALFRSPAVFALFKTYSDNSYLSKEDARFVKLLLNSFVSENHVKESQRDVFSNLLTQSKRLFFSYLENSAKDTFSITLSSSDSKDIPDKYKAILESSEDGFILRRDSIPPLEYLPAHIRSDVYRAYYAIGEQSNKEQVNTALLLRQKIAQMLGYNRYVDYRFSRSPFRSYPAFVQVMEKICALYAKQIDPYHQKLITYAKENKHFDYLRDGKIAQESFDLLAQAYEKKENPEPFQSAAYFVVEEVIPKILNLYQDATGFIISVENVGEDRWIISCTKDASLFGVIILDIYSQQEIPRGPVSWPLVMGGGDMVRISTVRASYQDIYSDRAACSWSGVSGLIHELGHSFARMSTNLRWAFAGPGTITPVSGVSMDTSHTEVDPTVLQWLVNTTDIKKKLSAHYETKQQLTDEQALRCRDATIDKQSVGLICMYMYALVSAQNQENLSAMNEQYWNVIAQYNTNISYLKGLGVMGNCANFMAHNYGPDLYKYAWASIVAYSVSLILEQQGLSPEQAIKKVVQKSLLYGGTLSYPELLRNITGQTCTIDTMIDLIMQRSSES